MSQKVMTWGTHISDMLVCQSIYFERKGDIKSAGTLERS